MTAVERALRHIERLIARASPRPKRKPAKRRTAPYIPPRAPVDEAKLAEQQQVFAPPPIPSETPPVVAIATHKPAQAASRGNRMAVEGGRPVTPFEWSITAERTTAVAPMSDAEALRRGILPDGELLDDVLAKGDAA